MPGMGPAMVADYPEVVNFTRFWSRGSQLFRKEDQQLLVEDVRAVDSNSLTSLISNYLREVDQPH
jgi:putative ABC transport system permease protein